MVWQATWITMLPASHRDGFDANCPAALVITANSMTKTYGQIVTFAETEFTTSGLVNGDMVTGVLAPGEVTSLASRETMFVLLARESLQSPGEPGIDLPAAFSAPVKGYDGECPCVTQNKVPFSVDHPLRRASFRRKSYPAL
jgi:hypothetical protein